MKFSVWVFAQATMQVLTPDRGPPRNRVRILAEGRTSAQPNLGFDLPPEEHDVLCVDAPSILADWLEVPR